MDYRLTRNLEERKENMPQQTRVSDLTYTFNREGVDYFGPLEIVAKTNTEEVGLPVHVPKVTRAGIHLEIAQSLNTDSCLQAIKPRYIARRGQPQKILSELSLDQVGSSRKQPIVGRGTRAEGHSMEV